MLILSRKAKKQELPSDLATKRERFGRLAHQHQELLLRIALKYSKGDEARAHDYVQDALVNGYQAYLKGSFQDDSNMKAWLVRILTNVFLNDHRRRTRWEASVELDHETGMQGIELVAPPDERPDVSLVESVFDGPIEAAMEGLPEQQRLCVVLVDIEGLDYAEAAAALDVPIGTVRSRLARARMALHGRLVEYGRARGY